MESEDEPDEMFELEEIQPPEDSNPEDSNPEDLNSAIRSGEFGMPFGPEPQVEERHPGLRTWSSVSSGPGLMSSFFVQQAQPQAPMGWFPAGFAPAFAPRFTVLVNMAGANRQSAADATFAGEGSGPQGSFTMSDWDAAVRTTQDACYSDFERLCVNPQDQVVVAAPDEGSTDSEEAEEEQGDTDESFVVWMRRRLGCHDEAPADANAPAPLGFGSRDADQCLLDQRADASAMCRLSMAKTEAVYRDLVAQGLHPRPPSHHGGHAVLCFALLVGVTMMLCCVARKRRRFWHAHKAMRRTLEALEAGDPAVKVRAFLGFILSLKIISPLLSPMLVQSALEDAAGVSLPVPGWRHKVYAALEVSIKHDAFVVLNIKL